MGDNLKQVRCYLHIAISRASDPYNYKIKIPQKQPVSQLSAPNVSMSGYFNSKKCAYILVYQVSVIGYVFIIKMIHFNLKSAK